MDKWIETIKFGDGVLHEQTQERDLLKIDDTWLKFAQILWQQKRKAFGKSRREHFSEKQSNEWITLALKHATDRHSTVQQAGQMLCKYV